MEQEYQDFLATKRFHYKGNGLTVERDSINSMLFEFQKDIVSWAIRKGRAAIFLDTGLGKTFIQIEWARMLGVKTLIIAPLSVAKQTIREAAKLGVQVTYVRNVNEVNDNQVCITNYEMIESFDFSVFEAVVLDESSILKAIGGVTRKKLIKLCQNVKYRLACTATPAPNDVVEIGNHAEWLGVCTEAEMKGMFFINANKEHTIFVDGQTIKKKGSNANGTEWRLRHHAEAKFFEWLSSWAITMTKPSDLGYDDTGFVLPALNIFVKQIAVDFTDSEQLFYTGLHGLKGRLDVKKQTIQQKAAYIAELVNASDDQWLIWTWLEGESSLIHKIVNDSVEVVGSDSQEYKVKAFEDFQAGKTKVLISKPKICGFGMNFQNAHNMVFFGISDSWESWYQCIRREWRYGQKQEVNVYVIIAEVEAEVYDNIKRKDAMATRLRSGLLAQIKEYEKGELKMVQTTDSKYKERDVFGDGWQALLGDSCLRLREIETDSVDLSVYSPPFASLYTYTDSQHDLGNSRDDAEFFKHYNYLISEILRVTKPGRLTCVHVSDIPAMAQKDGYIGIKDFPGDVIRAYESAGWVFHGRAFIQKNPQSQAVRTKSKALLFVQLRKDSSDSRPALIDQILIFKKPGNNQVPINPTGNKEMDNETWIEWANGIWLGIHETDTLQYSKARDENDEKHICPLQLGTIERCIKLYSNPGETVLTPFGGIGSEGYMAVKLHRKAILIELKESYFEILIKNLREAEQISKTRTLFDELENND